MPSSAWPDLRNSIRRAGSRYCRRPSRTLRPRRRPISGRRPAIDPAGPLRDYNRIYEQNLDGLTLKLRAIEAMLPLDARKARELFTMLAPPDLPRQTCDDYLVPDLDRFYDVLGKVAARSFNAREIERREPFSFLSRYASAITSPVQIAPAARMAQSAALGDGDFQNLVSALAASIRGMSGDDRAFSSSRAAGPQIRALAAKCTARGLSPLALLEAYRAFLVANLSGVRCAGSAGLGGAAPQGLVTSAIPVGPGPDFATYFNEEMRMPPLPAIEARQTEPSRIEGSNPAPKSCEDAECRASAGRMRLLVVGPGGMPYSAAARAGIEWKTRLDEFLSSLAAWTQSAGIPEGEFYREKAGFYNDLMGIVTDGADRVRVGRAALLFFSASRFRANNRLEWFLPVNALIGRARLDPSMAGLDEDLRVAGDPVIGLYAAMERAFPRASESIMGVM